MKNKISRLLLLAFVVLGTISVSSAQMKPAKMLPPKTKREVTIKAPANEVWKLLASLEKVEEYVPTLVKSFISTKIIGIAYLNTYVFLRNKNEYS